MIQWFWPLGHFVDDYVCPNCESKISMVSYKKHLMKALAPESRGFATFVPRIRRGRVQGFPHSSGTVNCELSTVDSAKSFRMRSYKQTPCFARFWPKLSVCNPFRMRTYEKSRCNPFRMRSYKKGGGDPNPSRFPNFDF